MVGARAGRSGFVLNADDPLVADLGRDRELRRREGVTYFGIEDPVAGAARAPARPRRQALPPLRRTRTPTSAPSSATSATTSCPNCGADRPGARRRRDRDRAARHARARARGSRTPGRRARARAAAARPLQRLQRARRARRRAAARGRRSRPRSAALASVEAAFGRVETIEVAGSAGLDPADQEPGRRERGPAHAAARGRARRDGAGAGRARPLDRAQRPDRRRPRRLLDLGRRLRAARRGRAAGRLRRAPGRRRWRVRLKYAGIDPRADRGRRRRSSARSTAPSPAPTGALFALPTYTALIELRTLLAARGLARGVLAMSAGAASQEAIWHDVECGGYAADLALWAELAPRGRRPGARARRRHRAGRRCDLAARGHRGDRARPQRAAARGELRRARGGARARGRDGLRRRPRVRARRELRARSSRRCSSSTCSAARPGAQRCSTRRRRHLRAGRAFAARCSPTPPPGRRSTPLRPPLARRARARRLGLLEPAARGRRRARRDRGAAAAPGRLPGRRARAEQLDVDPPRRARPPTTSSPRPRAPGSSPRERIEIAADRRPRRLGRLRAGGRLMELRAARALPGADEHLRRPRQHPLPAPALRVARDRLRATPAPGPGEGFDPGAHDLIYIGGGQDRDQRAGRRGHAARPSATRSRPRSTTAPSCSPSAAATSCSATATSSAASGSTGLGLRRPRDGPRAGPAADRQRRDRGRPRRRRRSSRSPASRTTAGAPTSAPARSRSAG